MKASASIDTSISGLQRMAVSYDHTVGRKNFKSNFGVETPIRGYDKFGATLEHTTGEGAAFNTKAQITTPIEVSLSYSSESSLSVETIYTSSPTSYYLSTAIWCMDIYI